MAGSEMGDAEMMEASNMQAKAGQRISAREKRPVNYSSMNHGTEAVNSNMDYSEVSGTNRAMQKKGGSQVNPKEVK